MKIDKNKTVLLINPPFYRLFNAFEGNASIGLLYMAAVLREKGYNTAVYNSDFIEGSDIFQSDIVSKKEMFLKGINDMDNEVWGDIGANIRKFDPCAVGISIWTGAYYTALNVAKIVKKINPEIPVIVGGIHPTALPLETIKEKDYDFVIKGEGEFILLNLLKALQDNKDLKEVKGIVFKKNGEVIDNPNAELISDIDVLPEPARDLIFTSYGKKDVSPYGHGKVLTTRGCPFLCTFCCSHLIWGRKVRFRDINKVVDEIESMYRDHGTRKFDMADETFTLNKERVLEFCRIIKERKLKITLNCKTRVDIIDEEIFRALKSAGCTSIAIGVESGNKEMLKRIKKGINMEQVENAVKIAKKVGMDVRGYFMVGIPGETEESIKDTIGAIERMDFDFVNLGVFTPYPGTDIYQELDKEGKIDHKRWSEYYHLGRKGCIAKLDTISKDKLMEYTKKMQDNIDIITKRTFRKRLRSPKYLLNNIHLKNILNPKTLMSKTKLVVNILKK